MDIAEEKGFVSPEEAALYWKVLSRAKKDKVITPYSNETFKNARHANSSGFLQGFTGNISKEFRDKLLKKYSDEK